MALDKGLVLLSIARGAIAEGLGEPGPPCESAPWLLEPGATFVSLHLEGQLRGCMGSPGGRRPLGEDVAANARAAAFLDSRFPALSRPEFSRTEIEVSLLSRPERIPQGSQAEAEASLRPGVDGVVLEYGWKRGVFLPQVWAQLPEPASFMAHLKVKAGLPPRFWSEEIRVSRFIVEAWREHPSPVGKV